MTYLVPTTRSNRSIRLGLGVTALAAAGVISGLAATSAPACADPGDAGTSGSGRSEQASPQEHQRYAYAVLQAPGWRKVAGDSTRDGQVAYTDESGNRVSLQWHPRSTDRAPYQVGVREGTAILDGDRAPVHVYQDIPTAVGPVVNGHFLTFSSTTLDADQLADLAGQVHRTAYATLETPGWVANAKNVPGDDKLAYRGAGGARAVLNWRPGGDYGPKFREGDLVGHAKIDGQRAAIYEDPAGSGDYTVVARPKHGKFLTLASTSLSEPGLRSLAAQVHRR